MTKRIWITLCVFFLMPLIMCSGCGKSEEKKEIVTDFSASFTASYRDMEIKGTVSTNRQGVTDIDITYPETLSGLSVSYRNSEMQISRESLVCSADEAYIPEQSFPSLIKTIFRGIGEGRANYSSSKENLNTYTLETGFGNCTVKTDSDGKIISAEISGAELSVEFSDIKVFS